MATTYTIDASVWINAFNPAEHGHSQSQLFLAELQARQVPLIVPNLLLPEVSATIARGSGDAELALRFALALARLPHLILVSLDDTLAQQAAQMAAQYRLRGADAVYAAVAVRFGCTLVTLDHEQLQRLASVLPTQRPIEALTGLE